MYFCPKCNYSFDISKSSGSSDDEIIMLKKPTEAIKIYETSQDLTNYRAEFKLEELQKNVKYKKLNEDEKEKFNVLFHIINTSGAQFQCNNCNFSKPITETVLLYQYNIINTDKNIKTLEENQLMCKNPILPRTHDYNCKNIDCPSHKSKTKEAVFIRDKDTYKINYICCICYYNW